jgi:hypothetical protein
MIHHATQDFNFNQLHLATPVAIQGGSFFSKLNFSPKDDSLYVYTPKCTAKGISSGSKQFIDFIFVPSNTNFIQWMDALEEKVQTLIYEKRDTWFEADSIELDDIQNSFIPMMKLKGNQYLLRGYIPQGKQAIKEPPIQIYDEHEMPVLLSSIKESSDVISILDIHGIKFNQKCFQLIVNIRQMMVLEKTQFSNCLIKLDKEKQIEVKLDILEKIEKPKNDAYKVALEKANRIAKEAEEARIRAEELKTED